MDASEFGGLSESTLRKAVAHGNISSRRGLQVLVSNGLLTVMLYSASMAIPCVRDYKYSPQILSISVDSIFICLRRLVFINAWSLVGIVRWSTNESRVQITLYVLNVRTNVAKYLLGFTTADDQLESVILKKAVSF